MYADLTPENEAFLECLVVARDFPSRGDALNAAVNLLRRKTAIVEKIRRGLKQLDDGQYTEFDEAGLERYFVELFLGVEDAKAND
jgi:Arc/MetJ-type ribon-helix-helix transcriptional regulator